MRFQLAKVRGTTLVPLGVAWRLTSPQVAAPFGLANMLDSEAAFQTDVPASYRLFELTPLDPATFVAVAVLFLVVGLMAACLPALRASRVDPLVALRHD